MGAVAKDIMTANVISAHVDMTVDELTELLHKHSISGAPVIDALGRLVGVVSATDIILQHEILGGRPAMDSDYHRQIESRDDPLLAELFADEFRDHEDQFSNHKVRDIMSADVISAQQDTPISELAGIMYNARIHRVIVLDGDRLAGIASTMDILKAVMEENAP